MLDRVIMKSLAGICVLLLGAPGYVGADVYLEFNRNLPIVTQLLSSARSDAVERYFVMNSVPIRTHVFASDLSHQQLVTDFFNRNYLDQPLVLSGDSWSAAVSADFKLYLQQKNVEQPIKVESVIVFARARPEQQGSSVTLLQFDQPADILKLMLGDQQSDDCAVDIPLPVWPGAQQLYCLNEMSPKGMVSQTLVYSSRDHGGDRLGYYQRHLAAAGFHTQGESERIVLMADEFISLAIFSYYPEHQAAYAVLDVFQIDFTKTLGADG